MHRRRAEKRKHRDAAIGEILAASREALRRVASAFFADGVDGAEPQALDWGAVPAILRPGSGDHLDGAKNASRVLRKRQQLEGDPEPKPKTKPKPKPKPNPNPKPNPDPKRHAAIAKGLARRAARRRRRGLRRRHGPPGPPRSMGMPGGVRDLPRAQAVDQRRRREAHSRERPRQLRRALRRHRRPRGLPPRARLRRLPGGPGAAHLRPAYGPRAGVLRSARRVVPALPLLLRPGGGRRLHGRRRRRAARAAAQRRGGRRAQRRADGVARPGRRHDRARRRRGFPGHTSVQGGQGMHARGRPRSAGLVPRAPRRRRAIRHGRPRPSGVLPQE
mmetsp:Transcript_23019/g.71602  ORF Transcript_23019/g.71602 Transcript_23019/m.71602 type:complete len:332 (+) Transcript_23019:74-1069(+)